jgi:light-regulated signal transduction histidine kinase (bacteriophytochrome)
MKKDPRTKEQPLKEVGHLRTGLARAENASEKSKVNKGNRTGPNETAAANQELRDEINVLRKAVKELESANRELNDFAYIVSHDLKAPLRAVSAIANWIAADYADKFDDKGREQIKLLVSRVKRMHDFIEAVLQYSRIGRNEEGLSAVDLNELIPRVIKKISPPENITIVIEDSLPVVPFGRARLEQIFRNLLSNAVKFMDKPDGRIRILCSAGEGCYRFGISDNGPGIQEKHFDKIFRICQTLSPRDEFDGTGVGLAMVKKIVEMFGGSIWVESEVGHGSTFYFTLPKGTCNETE